jgi:TrwC relaxase
VLFKANVAASETYNTALEQRLRDNLEVRFAERPGTDQGKRPIREIVGVDPRLNQRWSTRRAHIDTRRGKLAIQFQEDHGRPPTAVEALHLAQRATLETPRRQARTPIPGRATRNMARRSCSGIRQRASRCLDGANGAGAAGRDRSDRRLTLDRRHG